MYFLDQRVIVEEELHIIQSFYQSLLNTESFYSMLKEN